MTARELVPVPLEERRRYTATDCTLDGKPAVIAGALEPFATVAQLPHGMTVEYAWPTVARIVAAGAAFHT